MGVCDKSVIDGLAVEKSDGAAVLYMDEARPWELQAAMLVEFEAKLNGYLDFIFGGQMEGMPQFAGRPARVELHCQYAPPMEVMHMYRLVRDHIGHRGVGFSVYFGADRSCPMDLDTVDRGGGLESR